MGFGGNYYSENGTRRFPVDDGATGEDDAGLSLPDDILVDANIRFPQSLGECLAISAITVTRRIVTVVFAALPSPPVPPADSLGTARPADPADGFRPVCAVSLAQPILPGKTYRVDPLAAGVGGWLVFGTGVSADYRGRFSATDAAFLTPRAARAYRDSPVSSVGKLGSAVTLTGVVRLRAGNDVEIVTEERELDGETRTAIVVRLRSSDGSKNVFTHYAGPCSGSPADGTCDPSGLESITGVTPDCDGNITLSADDLEITPFAGGGGLVLDYNRGASDVCRRTLFLPKADGSLPFQSDGECGGISDLFADAYSSAGDVPVDEPDESSAGAVGPCDELPYQTDFTGVAFDSFWERAGEWGFSTDTSSSSAEVSHETAPHLTALDPSGRNVLTWDDCGTGSTVGKTITAELRIHDDVGTLQIGGVVLNYRWQATPAAAYTYLAVVLDRYTARLRVLSWNGSRFGVLAQTTPLEIEAGGWYRLAVAVTEVGPGQVGLVVTMSNADSSEVAAVLSTTTNLYGPDTGWFGLTSDRSVVDFRLFRLEAP